MTKPEDPCAVCKHSRAMHTPKCSMWFCGCSDFSERLDPSPLSDADWDDSGSDDNPGDL